MDAQEEFRELQNELERIKERLDDIDEKLAEAHELTHALDELHNVEPGDEALVPLSSGVFLEAELTNTDTLKVNVGGGAVVEKTIPEAKEMVEGHIAELQHARGDVEDDYEEVVERADELGQRIPT